MNTNTSVQSLEGEDKELDLNVEAEGHQGSEGLQ